PHRFIDLPLERLEEIAPRERADLGLWIHRIPDDEILHRLRETSLEVIGDRPLGDESLSRDARLTVVLVARSRAGLRRRVDVRVSEDDVGIRAAKLENGLLQ